MGHLCVFKSAVVVLHLAEKSVCLGLIADCACVLTLQVRSLYPLALVTLAHVLLYARACGFRNEIIYNTVASGVFFYLYSE